jgi:hypothetical protein
VKLENDPELLAPLREAAQHVRCGPFLAVLLAEAKFFIDQLRRGLRLSAKGRIQSQIVLDERPLPRTPAPAQLLGQSIDQP